MTQNEQVLAYIERNGSITALDAVRFGCLRLAARIHDLIKSGHKIKSDMETENGKTFARYSIEKKFNEKLF